MPTLQYLHLEVLDASEPTKGVSERSYFFSSFFYSRLRDEGYEKVPSKSLFDYQFLFVPINQRYLDCVCRVSVVCLSCLSYAYRVSVTSLSSVLVRVRKAVECEGERKR